MSEYKIIPYDIKYFDKWNEFVARSNNGTLFHRLDFLGYHGGKFKPDEHHLILLKGETIRGVLPLAIFGADGKKIARSPYGASYGGFVFAEAIDYSSSKKIVAALLDYLQGIGVNEFYVTPSISIYCRDYSETFFFTMLEKGLTLINSDITSIVDLAKDNVEKDVFTSRIRNTTKKAALSGVSIKENADIDAFWTLMDKTFERHKTSPTHSKAEFKLLNRSFPESVYCDIAYIGNHPAAGIGYFVLNDSTIMSFYLCSDPEFKETQALSFLVYHAILKSKEKGFNYFDFGTSSIKMVGNENIFLFKESFGAVGRFRNTYKISFPGS